MEQGERTVETNGIESFTLCSCVLKKFLACLSRMIPLLKSVVKEDSPCCKKNVFKGLIVSK